MAAQFKIASGRRRSSVGFAGVDDVVHREVPARRPAAGEGVVDHALHVGDGEPVAAQQAHHLRRTVKKMLSYSAPPGYRRTKPVRRPKLDGFTGIVDAILEADTDPDVPRKQRHTAHRIFERLRDEHGFTGGYTIQTV